MSNSLVLSMISSIFQISRTSSILRLFAVTQASRVSSIFRSRFVIFHNMLIRKSAPRLIMFISVSFMLLFSRLLRDLMMRSILLARSFAFSTIFFIRASFSSGLSVILCTSIVLKFWLDVAIVIIIFEYPNFFVIFRNFFYSMDQLGFPV